MNENNENNELGTWIDGIGATEDLDSSGERIKVEGIDISSVTTDGVFNYEHNSSNPMQTVGKILEVKKIFKKEDCDNERHEYFWKKAGNKPFLYVAGVLFDKFQHPGAISVAAMLNFDKKLNNKNNTKNVVNFSIEGSKLDKKGVWINKCIMRKLTITVHACNKRCVAELLEKPEKVDEISKESLFDIFKKCEKAKNDLKKSISVGKNPSKTKLPKTNLPSNKSKEVYTTPKYDPKMNFKLKSKTSSKESYKPMTPGGGEHSEGSSIKPTRTFTSQEANDKKKMGVGDRISYRTKKPKTGKDIYNDPDTWKSENKAKKGKKKGKKKLDKFYSSNVRKALVASCGMGAPSTRNNGSALAREEIQRTFKKISNNCFNKFEKKDELVEFLSKRLPKCSGNEINALAKAVAYISEKKKEKKLDDMVKAKVDEGKTPKEKKKVRAERSDYRPKTKEKWTKPDEKGQQYRTLKVKDIKETEENKKKLKEKPKTPSKKDLEYPLAASEEKKVK